jgi:hypothetical protein
MATVEVLLSDLLNPTVQLFLPTTTSAGFVRQEKRENQIPSVVK